MVKVVEHELISKYLWLHKYVQLLNREKFRILRLSSTLKQGSLPIFQ